MPETPPTQQDRIEKGIAITAQAIKENNPAALAKCINHFHKLGAPADKIEQAIALCPISLIRQAGFNITIESRLLGRNIVIGKDISWDEWIKIRSTITDPADLKTIMEIKAEFGGTIEEITPSDPKDKAEGSPDKQEAAHPDKPNDDQDNTTTQSLFG
jgi:hypothetical protein